MSFSSASLPTSGAPAPIALRSRTATTRLRGGRDRQVAALSIGLAGVFLAATIASILLGGMERLGLWLPLHLLLAGAASTAIAGVMPFFSAAVSNAPPAATPVRLTGVLGVAAGATLIVVGRLMGDGTGLTIAGFGGLLFLVGIAAVTAATLLPLRSALGARRFFMGAVYGLALFNVAVGATLGTGYLLAWQPIIGAWAVLKPAHAWLNLFGFVSLAIAGSLLHLLPTVVGARISRTTASMVCFVAFVVGPLLAAIGFWLQVDLAVVTGALVTLVGALALAWHALTVLRARASWTTDPHWHAFTSGSLVAGIVWFVVACGLALAQVVTGGATAGGWSLTELALPLGLGWAAQVLVGAWSHLLPAVGPGSPEQHARQRAILGTLGPWRVAALNIGLAAAVAGQLLDQSAVLLIGVGVVISVGLLAVVLMVLAFLVLARPISRVSPGTAAR